MEAMNREYPKLRKEQLNRLFVDGLGDSVKKVTDITAYPLLIDLKDPYPLKLRVYLFNCTNPPGGRALDEFKIQVIGPGQKPGMKGHFDYSGGRLAILAAFVQQSEDYNDGIFVLWDADKHPEFSYSANFQVKADTIIDALSLPVACAERHNKEIILAAQPKHLLDAIRMRVDIMNAGILEECT